MYADSVPYIQTPAELLPDRGLAGCGVFLDIALCNFASNFAWSPPRGAGVAETEAVGRRVGRPVHAKHVSRADRSQWSSTESSQLTAQPPFCQ